MTLHIARTSGVVVALALLIACAGCGRDDEHATVRVGSKSFAESVILGELAVHLATDLGLNTEHRRSVSGTRLLWEAIRNGNIDVYPDYTGTLRYEIFSGVELADDQALRDHIKTLGLRMTPPLGFNNTYIMGMKEERAAELDIERISDLRAHPNLRVRVSNEFMQRGDGWHALASHYNLQLNDVDGMEHALTYASIDTGEIDVTDLYATDAKIRSLNLRTLEDDLGFFPEYYAVYVYRADLDERAPDFVAALEALGQKISEEQMIAMNAEVELKERRHGAVAAEFAREALAIEAAAPGSSLVSRVARRTREHLGMVTLSLGAATLLAIPLGILANSVRATAQPILAVVGIIQTIPSIALLVLLIRPVGQVAEWFGYNAFGFPQAVVALFLYSLLPIVRNTHTGLAGIPAHQHEAAIALGLPWHVRLWRIELPLASRTILAGIKTAAVINVGFATLGGFISAGGYGQPIFEGITLNNYGRILEGALPAAGLALVVQGLFELLERFCVPKGLRIRRGS